MAFLFLSPICSNKFLPTKIAGSSSQCSMSSIFICSGTEDKRQREAGSCHPCVGQPLALMSHQSQNHQTTECLRLEGTSGVTQSNPLPKQGHTEQAAQELVQEGLEYLQRRRLHNLPGQPVPVLCHPQSEEALPHLQLELPLLQFVPAAPCPVAGHH